MSISRSPLRRTLAGLAVLATLPYLGLKVAWLSGSRIGLNDPTFGTGTVMEIANTVTACMEAVAVVLAFALVSGWGRRVAAPVLLMPAYVASGLLGAIVVILPVQLAVLALTHGPHLAEAPPGPIQGWVFAMVYGAFSVLGVCLLWLFALYARDRWLRPGGWLRRVGELPVRGARTIVVTWVVVVATVALGVALIVDAITDPHADWSYSGGHLVLTLLAGAGLAAVTARRPAGLPAWVALVATWVGSASMAAWGLYLTVLMVVPNDVFPADEASGWAIALQVARLVVGLAAVGLVLGGHRDGSQDSSRQWAVKLWSETRSSGAGSSR